MSKVFRAMKSRAAVVGAALSVAGMSAANAAVDITAQTAAATTDVEKAGGLIIGVVVAIAVVAWIRKVIH